MVSKVAVIALVGILAIPILLGYGLNLNEVSETTYSTSGDKVDVTPLLQNGTYYTNAHADAYQLNVAPFPSDQGNRFNAPFYDTITSTSTTTPGTIERSVNAVTRPTANYYFSDYDELYAQVTYGSSSTGYVTASLTAFDNDSHTSYWSNTYPKFAAAYVDYENDQLIMWQYASNDIPSIKTVIPYPRSFRPFTADPGFVGEMDVFFIEKTPTSYVDLSGGFHFNKSPVNSLQSNWRINTPNETQSLLMTVNLDSVEDADYRDQVHVVLGYGGYFFRLVKTTVDDVVKWEVRSDEDELIQELYYDPSRTDNTYQILIDVEYTGEAYEPEYDAVQKNYDINFRFRYVGGWPALIGAANYYLEYEFTALAQADAQYPLSLIQYLRIVNTGAERSLTMRMDDALYSAFQYNVIDNQVYTPSNFKTNPSTKLTNIQKYGLSITFGGNTYPVGSDGNITLGTHQVSVNNIVFDSVPVPVGYENRINGNVISVSAQPSSITFAGSWSMNVTTTGQAAATITKTEWIPGQFAWDGIDDNFLMVGLITCLGVFIGLGIYARSHRMSIWPLLLVCGGAAALFIFMI